ncbi:MAG TPA: hypothetical protein VFC00_31970 [Micromonosporaceae bacterium]|nr:hypothetical protein [Micromonosporaceae bacterium]
MSGPDVPRTRLRMRVHVVSGTARLRRVVTPAAPLFHRNRWQRHA